MAAAGLLLAAVGVVGPGVLGAVRAGTTGSVRAELRAGLADEAPDTDAEAESVVCAGDAGAAAPVVLAAADWVVGVCDPVSVRAATAPAAASTRPPAAARVPGPTGAEVGPEALVACRDLAKCLARPTPWLRAAARAPAAGTR